MTKKELECLLSEYPDDARVYFDDDANNRAMTLTGVSYIDDDFVPDLSFEQPCPKIFLHLK